MTYIRCKHEYGCYHQMYLYLEDDPRTLNPKYEKCKHGYSCAHQKYLWGESNPKTPNPWYVGDKARGLDGFKFL